jgi:hypothetical protein
VFYIYDVHRSKWIYGCDFEDYSKWRVGKHVKGIFLKLYEALSKMYLETLNKRHDERRRNSRPGSDCKKRNIRNTKQKLNWILNFMTRTLNISSSKFRCCTWYPNRWGGGRGGRSLTVPCWASKRCMQLGTLFYLVPKFKTRVAWSFLDRQAVTLWCEAKRAYAHKLLASPWELSTLLDFGLQFKLFHHAAVNNPNTNSVTWINYINILYLFNVHVSVHRNNIIVYNSN